MNYFLGDFKLNCNFDPNLVNNASEIKKKIEDIGFIYNCVYKQKNAFLFSLKAIRATYPYSRIYVVSDGGDDYSFIENEKIKFKMDQDTVSSLKILNYKNYLEPQNQFNIKRGIKATINRLSEGIAFCGNPEWFCMTEPDVFIRGEISYPINAKLLGSRVNYAWYEKEWLKSFIEINKLLSRIKGAIPITRWGAVPVIGKTETFLKGVEVYKNNYSILDSLSEKFPAISGFDLLLPLIFALAGEEEVYSSDFTECIRNPDWKKSSATVIHQFREYYDEDDFFKLKSQKIINISSIKSRIKSLFRFLNFFKKLFKN